MRTTLLLGFALTTAAGCGRKTKTTHEPSPDWPNIYRAFQAELPEGVAVDSGGRCYSKKHWLRYTSATPPYQWEASRVPLGPLTASTGTVTPEGELLTDTIDEGIKDLCRATYQAFHRATRRAAPWRDWGTQNRLGGGWVKPVTYLSPGETGRGVVVLERDDGVRHLLVAAWFGAADGPWKAAVWETRIVEGRKMDFHVHHSCVLEPSGRFRSVERWASDGPPSGDDHSLSLATYELSRVRRILSEAR